MTKNLNHKKTVLVGGCFDILHYGHINFLKKAKSKGDYLIVALESDENVRKLKGLKRPIHSQKLRREMLQSLEFVDKIIDLPIMQSDLDYQKLVLKLKPDIIAVTDGDPILDIKRAQAETIDAKVVVIPKVKNVSTSDIVKALESEV